MKRTNRLRLALACMALGVFAAPAQAAIQFSEITDPEGVIGERRTTAVVHLNGAAPENVSVYVTYARTREGVDARPGTYGTASCDPGAPGTLRCTMVFPHPHHPLPNDSNVVEGQPNEGIVIGAGDAVHYRWRKDVRVSFSNELLLLSSPHQSFVMPRRLVVANIGDSYAAGEGAPGAGAGADQWIFPLCHRSEIGGQRQGIRDFIADNPGIAVHYRNFPCSGAGVYFGLIGADPQFLPHMLFGGDQEIPLEGGSDSDTQLNKLVAWMDSAGHAKIDALFVSIGGNDSGFGTVVSDCLLGILSDCPTDPRITELVSTGLDNLYRARPGGQREGFYVDLDDQIERRLGGPKTFVFEYPDPTRDANGRFCDADANDYACFGLIDKRMKAGEARFAYDEVLVPLNRHIKQAADALDWVFLGDSGIRADGSLENTAGHVGRTRTRGICNCNSGFFNTLKQSDQLQADLRGSVHPSPPGQDGIYRQTVRTALRDHFGEADSRRVASPRLLTAITAPVALRGEPAWIDPDEVLDDAPVEPRVSERASRITGLKTPAGAASTKAAAKAKALAAARAKAKAEAAARARAKAEAAARARARQQAVAKPVVATPVKPALPTPVKPELPTPVGGVGKPMPGGPGAVQLPRRVVVVRDLSKLPPNVAEKLRRHDDLLRDIYANPPQ